MDDSNKNGKKKDDIFENAKTDLFTSSRLRSKNVD